MVKLWVKSDKAVAAMWVRSVIYALTCEGGYALYDDPYTITTTLPVSKVVQVVGYWAVRPYLRSAGLSVTWSVMGDGVCVTISDQGEAIYA